MREWRLLRQMTLLSRTLFRRSRVELELDDELQFHIEQLVELEIAKGISPKEARFVALRAIGGLEQWKEECRDARRSNLIDDLLRDLRYAWRSLRRSPSFAVLILTITALGIGANTAVFSVVNAVLLKPISAPEPDRIILFETTRSDGPPNLLGSETRFNAWRAQTSLFQDISAYRYGAMNLTGVDTPQQVQIAQVSANYFHLFGLVVARGRAFTAEEDLPNAGHFALLSHAFWSTSFAGDPGILGRTISLSSVPYTIIGVMAPGVQTESPLPIDVWIPFQIDPASTIQNHYFSVAGRIKAGITPVMIKAQLHVAADQYRKKFSNVSTMLPGYGFGVEPMQNVLVRDVRVSLMILVGAVAFVLLIACANVANLLLIRATSRRREIAVRLAVGASPRRIIRQLLAESVVLSFAGGTLGLVLGIAGIRALLTLNPGNIPRIGVSGSVVTADWRVVTFTIFVSMVIGIICGLIPAIQASRLDLNTVLKESGGRSGTDFRQNKARSLLVICQIGVALILLIGSGLLIRTFIALRAVETGFNTQHVLTLQMSLTGDRFQKTGGVAELVKSSIERFRTLPGVVTAAAGCCLPTGPVPNAPFVIVGRELKGGFHARANFPAVSLEYFDVFKIPILRGRGFSERDAAGAPKVVIINQTMARQFWPNGEALGAQIQMGSVSDKAPPAEIIGIAQDVHERTERSGDPPSSIIYLPLAQTPDGLMSYTVRQPFVWMVRTQAEPGTLTSAIKKELEQASGGLPVTGIRSMNEIMSRSTSRQDLGMVLMTVFGGCALLLAATGIYGLMAHSVQQRQHEIGIRLALGAVSSEVRNMIVIQSLRLTLIGITIGVMAALGLTQFLRQALFGVTPLDPVVFACVPVLLCTVALLATWLPALRASRIHPADSLRYE